MHAEATDAIAVLEEHVPAAPVPRWPDALMDGAIEPPVSAARIEVPVPVGSVAALRTLDRAIEAALDLSREGLVLAPPTQPEVQAFRRWMCRRCSARPPAAAPSPGRRPTGAGRRRDAAPGVGPPSVTEAPGGV